MTNGTPPPWLSLPIVSSLGLGAVVAAGGFAISFGVATSRVDDLKIEVRGLHDRIDVMSSQIVSLQGDIKYMTQAIADLDLTRATTPKK